MELSPPQIIINASCRKDKLGPIFSNLFLVLGKMLQSPLTMQKLINWFAVQIKELVPI